MAFEIPKFTSLHTPQKILYITTIGALIGMLLMLVCISTDYWIILTFPYGVYRNSTNGFVTGHHSGLWRICRQEFDNSSYPVINREYCTLIQFFPDENYLENDPEIDPYILNYSRTETAFSIISLFLMTFGLIFSVYALNEPRYMFKRLASLIHFIVAMCILVCAEVLHNSVDYEQEHLPARHPPGSYFSFGYSFVLSWVVFAIFLIAGVIFLALSRKKKGEKASSEKEAMENEPVRLSRR